MGRTNTKPTTRTRKPSPAPNQARTESRPARNAERKAAAALAEAALDQRKQEKIKALKGMTRHELEKDAYFHSWPQNHEKYPDKYAFDVRFPVWPDYIALAFDPDIASKRERAMLAICQRVVREERGSSTPIESFICKLLYQLHHTSLNPEDVRDYVQELVTDWNVAVGISQKLDREYLGVDPVEEE